MSSCWAFTTRGRGSVIAVTGGGSTAISTLLGVGGASRSVLAATVPYAEGALIEWLGPGPRSFVRSVRRGRWRWRPLKRQLRSERQRLRRRLHGEPGERSAKTRATSRTPGVSNNDDDGDVVDRTGKRATLAGGGGAGGCGISLNLIADACGIEQRLALPLGAGEELVQNRVVAPHSGICLPDETESLACGPARQDQLPRAIFPASSIRCTRGTSRWSRSPARC